MSNPMKCDIMIWSWDPSSTSRLIFIWKTDVQVFFFFFYCTRAFSVCTTVAVYIPMNSALIDGFSTTCRVVSRKLNVKMHSRFGPTLRPYCAHCRPERQRGVCPVSPPPPFIDVYRPLWRTRRCRTPFSLVRLRSHFRRVLLCSPPRPIVRLLSSSAEANITSTSWSPEISASSAVIDPVVITSYTRFVCYYYNFFFSLLNVPVFYYSHIAACVYQLLYVL